MNNWRLLLLAVVAVLQPIASFTERNLIDGRQECCDHRSDSLQQNSRLYGTYRKTTLEKRLLNAREYVREDRRYEPTQDLSRERSTLERVERRISHDIAEPTVVSRLDKEQNRHRILSEAREVRDDQNRRTRQNLYRNTLNQYERDALDHRRVRLFRDDSRLARVSTERLFAKSPDSRQTRRLSFEEIRRDSHNRATMAVSKRERHDVVRTKTPREGTAGAFLSESRLDNNRDRRTLDSRESMRSRSIDTRVNNEVHERKEFLSRKDSREDSRSSFKGISENVDERRQQRGQNRETRDRTATRRNARERLLATERRESRDDIEQLARNWMEIRNNKMIDERRQQRDESRLSHKRSVSTPQELRRSNSNNLARYFQNNVRLESDLRNSQRMDERQVSRDSSGDTIRVSQGSTFGRIQDTRDSRISRVLEATRAVRLARNERFSQQQVSIVRASRDVRFAQRQYNSRDSTRLSRILERNIRDNLGDENSKDVRGADRLDDHRQQRDESRLTERTNFQLRESKDSTERKQELRRIENPAGSGVNSRSERGTRIRGNIIRSNRFEANSREREERVVVREQTTPRLSRDRRLTRESNRAFRLAERTSNDRGSTNQEEIRSKRFVVRKQSRDNRVSEDRTIGMQRLTRAVSTAQRRYDTRRITEPSERNTRMERAKTLEDVRNNERHALRRQEIEFRAHDRTLTTLMSRETIEGMQTRDTRDSQDHNRHKVARIREDIRTGERFEIHRQRDESRISRDILSTVRQPSTTLSTERGTLLERRSRVAIPRDMSIRHERHRDDRRINERQFPSNRRDIQITESRRESRMTEREVKPNRYHLAMERMDRVSMRGEAKLRSSDVILVEDTRFDVRRKAVEIRFRDIEAAKVRESVDEEKSENQIFTNWEMVFYTLQGAYLCGLLMQMVIEKPNKGKSRTFTWWASSKDLVKVD